MVRKTAKDFDQGLLNLFDKLVHGDIDRRQFLDRAAKYAVGGATAAALLETLSPQYALAQQVAPDDPRIDADYVDYASPQGHGTIRGLLARPAGAAGRLPAVVVVHENRGLNPYIEDVARRLAVAGFIALAPDGLTPLGGYPGTDEEGREMQRQLDGAKLLEDFIAAYAALDARSDTGRIGVVGFCYGGGVCNAMAVRLPELAASVPFYGRQAAAEDVPKI
ncbi:MAG: dienelactone hydrolase family protein, partial [Inquilinus sp.]|nr:dienelactone hydrolase family protein [Inquilinus sp.]